VQNKKLSRAGTITLAGNKALSGNIQTWLGLSPFAKEAGAGGLNFRELLFDRLVG
jgi:hypothetical protein